MEYRTVLNKKQKQNKQTNFEYRWMCHVSYGVLMIGKHFIDYASCLSCF
jgi:hypothetical protein